MREAIPSRHRPPRSVDAQLRSQIAMATAQAEAARTALAEITNPVTTTTLAAARTKAETALTNLTFPTV